jgi:hypothetical protein
MLARRQPLAHLSRHRDVVTSLAVSFADDHLENERVVLGSAPDLDHVDLLADARAFIREPTLLADQLDCQWDATLPDLGAAE